MTETVSPTKDTISTLNIEEEKTYSVVSLNTNAMTPKVSTERAMELAKKINLNDSQSIISFGVDAQKQVTAVSENLISGSRVKDLGPVSNTMVEMVSSMRGLDFSKVKPGQKQGFISRLLRRVSSLTKFVQKYETVESQVITAQNKLDSHRTTLLRSILTLDKMYDATLNHVNGLDEHIAALEYKINEVDTQVIPELQAKADLSKDMADAQAVNDMIATRNQLDRQLHNLRATRMITIQTLPKIRMIQQNDKDLVDKIQAQILHGIPLWKQQMALNIETWKAAEAGASVKMASDFTNELITKGAEQLKESNKLIRGEVERGIIDVETVKKANDLLIATINETIELTEQGKQARLEAEKEFREAEENLKKALINAANRQSQVN